MYQTNWFHDLYRLLDCIDVNVMSVCSGAEMIK